MTARTSAAAPASLLCIMLRSTVWFTASASLCFTAPSRSACAFASASASRGSSSFIFFFSAMFCVSEACARAAASSAASDEESASKRCADTSASREAQEDLRTDSCCSSCSLASDASLDAFWCAALRATSEACAASGGRERRGAHFLLVAQRFLGHGVDACAAFDLHVSVGPKQMQAFGLYAQQLKLEHIARWARAGGQE